MAMKEGKGIKNPTAEQKALINTPATVTVEVGEKIKRVDGIEALLVLGYIDDGDHIGVTTMTHGALDAIKIAHMLNGIRTAVGDDMFMKAVIMETVVNLGESIEGESDDE